ncbi:MAG: hypothetical protein EPO24_04110 [Bacteroidetes bacterium]|nr:MAG: hypothetical protein EPO24_04110 [Bacteroidota bacterium]
MRIYVVAETEHLQGVHNLDVSLQRKSQDDSLCVIELEEADAGEFTGCLACNVLPHPNALEYLTAQESKGVWHKADSAGLKDVSGNILEINSTEILTNDEVQNDTAEIQPSGK